MLVQCRGIVYVREPHLPFLRRCERQGLEHYHGFCGRCITHRARLEALLQLLPNDWEAQLEQLTPPMEKRGRGRPTLPKNEATKSQTRRAKGESPTVDSGTPSGTAFTGTGKAQRPTHSYPGAGDRSTGEKENPQPVEKKGNPEANTTIFDHADSLLDRWSKLP